MPRVFDNIDQHLLPILRDTLAVSERADFCVGYFNLRGWRTIDDLIAKWQPDAGQLCRVLIGMQRPPHEDVRALYQAVGDETLIDNARASEIKHKFAAHLREQITFGIPTSADEKGLQRLARQLREGKVQVKLFLPYRLNRDIFIRLFDDRIEVESPGVFPGNITPANVDKAGSKARNPLIAQNLREFPIAPNIDAGEGVKMMFAEMASAKLYPPQYRQNTEAAVESVTVTLLNLERPTVWDEVSHWIDRNGPIANRQLREITGLDTLEASRMLRTWVAQGVLIALPSASRQQARYAKPLQSAEEGVISLSNAPDNELQKP